MTIIPLHPDPNDDSWDDEDYSLVESELMPVKVFEGISGWYWKVDHPALQYRHLGPFASAKLAYQDMMQYQKAWQSPTEMPDLVTAQVASAGVDSTAEALVNRMLDSPDRAIREKARELVEKHSYD
jgi:hypothetical protein